MFKERMVSVIMPVYNGERYLREAIESILNQTYRNFEFIITNDGSTDSSLEIINEYAKKDDRIIVISRKNRGLVYTLNEAIDIAKGDYIARMDADDISYPERFEKQVELLNRKTNIYIVGTNFDLLLEEDVTPELRNAMEKLQNTLNDCNVIEQRGISQGYILLHPTWMLRKELFQLVGKYGDFKAYEDGEFLFRTIAKGYSIDKIDEALFGYRIRNESKSAIDRKKHNFHGECIQFHIDYLEDLFGERLDNVRYLIWGASESGQYTYEYFKNKYPSSQLVAFIDSSKTGMLYGVNIIKCNEIDNYKFDYIFISTHGGAKFAQNYLQDKKYEEVRDFFVLL